MKSEPYAHGPSPVEGGHGPQQFPWLAAVRALFFYLESAYRTVKSLTEVKLIQREIPL